MSNQISEQIKERRRALGLTQGDLAKLVNLTQAQISRYERGDSDPPPDSLVALARALNTTTDYLLGVSNVVNPLQSEIEDEVLTLIKQFPPEKREEILRRLRFELELFQAENPL